MTHKPASLIEWFNHLPPVRQKHPYSYACFDCCKAFKEHLPLEGISSCPQCRGKLWFMGRRFKPPRQNDVTAWQMVYQQRTQARDLNTQGSRLLYRIEEDAGIRTRRGKRRLS